ncbi:MAG: carbohydrate ABC transporter permease [Polyangiaceae bacterium]|jgi:trehalose/maltose transport system permease protein|nr:carbohydrate ABC transporter permease [Polyangiaceae bacterium]
MGATADKPVAPDTHSPHDAPATPVMQATSRAPRLTAARLAGRVAFYLLVGAVLVYTIFPFFWAFLSSIKPNNELFATPTRYWPEHPTLDNYRIVLENDNFLMALRNSAVVAISVTTLSLALGLLAAYSLGRFRFRGRSLVLYTVLAMTMFPQIAVLGALFQMVNYFGLYNKLPALVLTYFIFTLPFTVWVLTGFLKAIPAEIEEAAYVDGASPFQVFYKIMLPLAVPGMATTGLLAFIAAWNEFLFALSFTQTPDKRTITYAIQAFSASTAGVFEIPWGPMMAASVLVTVPLVVLALIFQRQILAGLTAGAVKG